MSASFAIFLCRREIMPERLSFTVSGMFRHRLSIVRTANGKYLNAFLHGD